MTTQDNAVTKGPTHLILTCMDYRHMDDIVAALTREVGSSDAYDHLIVPGASLGILQEDHPEWGQAFWSQLAIARKLHGETIKHIWLIEHMDCGAYRAFIGGGMSVGHEELLHRAMASLVEEALNEWSRRQDTPWEITVSRKIMVPLTPAAKQWTLTSLEPALAAA